MVPPAVDCDGQLFQRTAPCSFISDAPLKWMSDILVWFANRTDANLTAQFNARSSTATKRQGLLVQNDHGGHRQQVLSSQWLFHQAPCDIGEPALHFSALRRLRANTASITSFAGSDFRKFSLKSPHAVWTHDHHPLPNRSLFALAGITTTDSGLIP